MMNRPEKAPTQTAESTTSASAQDAPSQQPSAQPVVEPFLARPISSADQRAAVPSIGNRLSNRPAVAEEESPQWWLPALLLTATCCSTFLAGALSWRPELLLTTMFSRGDELEAALMLIRRTILYHAPQGGIYMACVVGILFAHEMGHYVATRLYRIPASLPFFIPFPIAPVGTMGAVIAMKGQQANRREIFDIGIAGPLAGLVLALPIMWYGVTQFEASTPASGGYQFHLPLLVQWMFRWAHPGQPAVEMVYTSQLNAAFMAGWVGLLITGLNMLPISQLDGGHVTYTLFGDFSRWIARAFVALAIGYMAYTQTPIWGLMLCLIFFIGLYHPPTADDSVPLGRARVVLGLASLLIPILCFPPKGLTPI